MAKAGVMLMQLRPDTVQQRELELDLDSEINVADRSRLMTTLDSINNRYGRNTMMLASAGLAGTNRTWSMRQERKTPGYTTSWDDIAVARA